jgi:hypothetical protein
MIVYVASYLSLDDKVPLIDRFLTQTQIIETMNSTYESMQKFLADCIVLCISHFQSNHYYFLLMLKLCTAMC